VGYISSYLDQVNDGSRNRVAFVLATVHPDFTTLARGEMFPTSRPAVVVPPYVAQTDVAQTASVGFVSQEVDWFFFSTWGPGKPDWHWPALWDYEGGHFHIDFDHSERLILTLLESSLGNDVSGSLKNPNWKNEVALRNLTVRDHQADGLVLSGLDGNGPAVGITLRTF
jgi:hypothetical protein